MAIAPDVLSTLTSAAQQPGMRPRNDLNEPGGTFWELRTLNIQRVVGLAGEYRQFADARDLEAEIGGPSHATSSGHGGEGSHTES